MTNGAKQASIWFSGVTDGIKSFKTNHYLALVNEKKYPSILLTTGVYHPPQCWSKSKEYKILQQFSTTGHCPFKRQSRTVFIHFSTLQMTVIQI